MMNKKLKRWLAVSALAVSAALPFYSSLLHAQQATDAAQVASVQDLKDQAFKAITVGKFDLGSSLLAKAASSSGDPGVTQMRSWTDEFETQLKTFADERHKAYDKAVSDVKLLQKDHEDYALDFANRAQLLSDNKQVFHDEPWVKSLIGDSVQHAEEYEKSEQWLKALRIYSDLASIEPSTREWKERLKSVTRRVRLIALFTPDSLKSTQDKEAKERDAVDALLHPTATKPTAIATTMPTTDPAALEANKLDWRETVHGAKMSMLVAAMHDAAMNYYRDISYKDLLLGGIKGLRAVATTKGLENAFPSLGDPQKQAQFVSYLDRWEKSANTGSADDEQGLLDDLLSGGKDGLLAVNAGTIQLPEEVLVSEFADGALAELDPFSNMIWPSEQPEFNKTTQGEFSGVGIQIKSDLVDGSLRVVTPLEDSPAFKAGIKPDDVITAINGKSAKGISTNQAVKYITGPSGTTVKLTVRSPDATSKEYNIRREVIRVSSIKGYSRKPGGGWDYYVDPKNKIAYIRITNFTQTTAREMDRALDSLGDNVNGVILDLRGNPGGLLNAAIDVVEKYLKDGVIVSTHPDRETQNPPTIATAKDDDNEYTKPLVVLVNQYSASASEIVSGALKDDHRAILVGERTFGKGSVQMLFPLSDRTASLKLTTSHYYLPRGKCIHREENSTEWGVDPDVVVEVTPEQMLAAQDAREAMDVLRSSNVPNVIKPDDDSKLKEGAAKTEHAMDKATTQPKDPLSIDPQLSAALLVLRLQSAGAHL